MEILKSIVLGIVQGVTEFFPVSSSGHLVIIPFIFKWDFISLYHNIFLHFATLLALITVFYREIGSIIKTFFQGIFIKKYRVENNFKLALFIIIASIPAAFSGFFLENFVEDFFSSPVFVSIFLFITAALLITGEITGKRIEKKNAKKINLLISIVAGLGQALAIFPGISRSGTTISCARIFGVKREEAVKFSMLLSIPIIFGSFLYSIYSIYANATGIKSLLEINIFISFIFSYLSGLFAIKFLLRISRTKNLNFFAIYCIVIAIVIIVLHFIRSAQI